MPEARKKGFRVRKEGRGVKAPTPNALRINFGIRKECVLPTLGPEDPADQDPARHKPCSQAQRDQREQ